MLCILKSDGRCFHLPLMGDGVSMSSPIAVEIKKRLWLIIKAYANE